MVVYEIKDPTAVVTAARPTPLRRDIEPTMAIYGSQEIGRLAGRRERDREREREGRRGGRRMVSLDSAAVREARRLIEAINAQLDTQGTLIHLVLTADEEGFAIDLYDCSDGDACRCIHDISIGIGDLPVFLAKLNQKVGIMLDAVL
ncbi:MAG: hypothetical protein M0Z90_02710 [Desulfobacteraceae bacterium]|nr:hypothetical protein [Desulfobacteraceae bacterium]